MTTAKDITSMTPTEIDAVLYAWYVKEGTAKTKAEISWGAVHDRVSTGRHRNQRSMTNDEARTAAENIAATDPSYRATEARRALDRLTQALAALEEIRAAAKPYDDEFVRRGGWTRAFLVQQANGHVHNTMRCSTCNRGGELTRFAWMTEYSGKSEEGDRGGGGGARLHRLLPQCPGRCARAADQDVRPR